MSAAQRLKDLAKKNGITYFKDAADLNAKIKAKKEREDKELQDAIKADEEEQKSKAPPAPVKSPAVVSTPSGGKSEGGSGPVVVNVQTSGGSAPNLPWMSVAANVWHTVLTMVAGAAIYASAQSGAMTLVAKAATGGL